MSDLPLTAYKILTATDLAELEADRFAGAPIDRSDGYIHLSTAAQLAGTLDKHFPGKDELWLAAVDLAVLNDRVKWETARDGALFPHIYGPLPLAAVIAYGPLERHADGSVKLPVAG